MSEKQFWSEFYSSRSVTEEASSFAQLITSYIKDKEYNTILDVGCGNGRDSRYFAKEGLKVLGIDQAISAVDNNNKIATNGDEYRCGDFTSSDFLLTLGNFDILYSRFTLHSVAKNDASSFLKCGYDITNDKGLLCIEVRSVKSDMFGKGLPDPNGDKDAWINGHYRRFVRKDELEIELKELGYEILYIDEKIGWSKYKDDDPVLIRIIARK